MSRLAKVMTQAINEDAGGEGHVVAEDAARLQAGHSLDVLVGFRHAEVVRRLLRQRFSRWMI